MLSTSTALGEGVWYVKSPSSQFRVPDMHSVAIPTCKAVFAAFGIQQP